MDLKLTYLFSKMGTVRHTSNVIVLILVGMLIPSNVECQGPPVFHYYPSMFDTTTSLFPTAPLDNTVPQPHHVFSPLAPKVSAPEPEPFRPSVDMLREKHSNSALHSTNKVFKPKTSAAKSTVQMVPEPEAVPASLQGAAVPEAVPAALQGAEPEAVPSALHGAVPEAVPAALQGAAVPEVAAPALGNSQAAKPWAAIHKWSPHRSFNKRPSFSARKRDPWVESATVKLTVEAYPAYPAYPAPRYAGRYNHYKMPVRPLITTKSPPVKTTPAYTGTTSFWDSVLSHITTPFPGNKGGECPMANVVARKCTVRCYHDNECGYTNRQKCCHDGKRNGCCIEPNFGFFESFVNKLYDTPYEQYIKSTPPSK